MTPKRRWDGAEDLTPERVLQIARSKGEFRVSWRYRDEALMKRCAKLARAGLLARRRGPPGETLFVPVRQPPPRPAPSYELDLL